MASINTAILAGNLTRDPEVRYTPAGTPVGKISLAVNERFRSKTGEDREEVLYIDIDVWGPQAEACGKHLTKGSPVLVEGAVKLDTWTDRESGQKRGRHKVRARRIHFLGSRDQRPETREGGETPARDDDGNLPPF